MTNMNPQIKQAKLETLEAIIKEVEGMKGKVFPRMGYTGEKVVRHQAIEDVSTTLQAELTLLKNER